MHDQSLDRPTYPSLFTLIQNTSLVPRPSTPPAFDRFQYAKTEGEGLGNLLTRFIGPRMLQLQVHAGALLQFYNCVYAKET